MSYRAFRIYSSKFEKSLKLQVVCFHFQKTSSYIYSLTNLEMYILVCYKLKLLKDSTKIFQARLKAN